MFLKKFSVFVILLLIIFSFGCSKAKKNPDYASPSEQNGIISNTADTVVIEPQEKTVATASVGDTVFMGSFEQDGINENGAEKIEWIVLEKSEEKALLISKNVLEVMPWYNNITKYSTWETSDVRSWLMDDFYNQAFSESEKALLVDHNTKITAEESAKVKEIILEDTYYYTDEERNNLKNYTGYDKVFLIDQDEVNKYFADPATAIAQGSEYAKSKGLYSDGIGCLWWLRDAGIKDAAYIAYDGSIYDGTNHEAQHIGVRPAIEIKY